MQHPACSMSIPLLTLLITPVLMVGSAKAATLAPASDDSVFASVGVGGIDLGYAKRFNSTWGGRVLLNSGISVGADDSKIHGNRYDAKYKVSPGVGVLADFYPIDDSGFHVSGGLYIAQQKVDLDGRRNASYSFNGHSYTAGQIGNLSGETKFRSVSPYIGVGWESKQTASGWRFVSDFGFKLLSVSSNKLDASGAASNAALRSDLAAEEKHLRSNGAGLVATVGASYSF